jgi:hypothetical protein
MRPIPAAAPTTAIAAPRAAPTFATLAATAACNKIDMNIILIFSKLIL